MSFQLFSGVIVLMIQMSYSNCAAGDVAPVVAASFVVVALDVIGVGVGGDESDASFPRRHYH